jgi:septal ring factor EnvC (AmiA/AmiB activator)
MWRNMRYGSVVALLVLLPSLALAAPSAADLKTSLESLKSSQQEAARLEKELNETNKALATLRTQATQNAGAVQQAERNASFAETRLESTIQALDKARAEYDLKRDAYAHTLRHLLALRELPPTAFFGRSSEVRTMLKTASAMHMLQQKLAQRTKEIAKTIATFEALKTRLANDRSYNSDRQKKLSAQNALLTRDLEARQKLQQKLAKDHAEAEARAKQFAKQSRNLQELISKLDAASAAAPKQAPATTTAKGQWQAPVAGGVLHRYGERKGPNDRYQGMVFAARPGGSVIAPSSGEVAFTGPFRDYGAMVLVRHQGGYISLIAGLADIRVALGQRVGAGEPIGRMGTGASPTLYVELRQGGKPIDPAVWFAKLSNHLAATP